MSFFYVCKREYSEVDTEKEKEVWKIDGLDDGTQLKEFYKIILEKLNKPPITYFSNRYRLYCGSACISGIVDECFEKFLV